MNIILSMKNKNNKKIKKSVAAKAATAPLRGLVSASRLDAKAIAYRRLLADPCHAPMVPPCAPGPSSGLLFRQRTIISPSFGNSMSNYQNGQFIFKLQPQRGRYHLATGYTTTSEATVVNDALLETGVLATSTCRAYRAVAACVKWVPNGPLSERSGTIHVAYNMENTGTLTLSDPGNYTQWMAMCQAVTSNTGNGPLAEAKWVPADSGDTEWIDVTATGNTGGELLVVGVNVDKFQAAAGATTTRGYLEVTVVWEWMPALGSGVTVPLASPSRNTVQEVISTLGDIGRFCVNMMPQGSTMVKVANGVYSAMMSGRAIAQRAPVGYLTAV